MRLFAAPKWLTGMQLSENRYLFSLACVRSFDSKMARPISKVAPGAVYGGEFCDKGCLSSMGPTVARRETPKDVETSQLIVEAGLSVRLGYRDSRLDETNPACHTKPSLGYASHLVAGDSDATTACGGRHVSGRTLFSLEKRGCGMAPVQDRSLRGLGLGRPFGAGTSRRPDC